MAHARLVHEGERRLHSPGVELVAESGLVPRKVDAHRHALRGPENVRGGIYGRAAPCGAQFALMVLLCLWIRHAAHQIERHGHDVRTYPAELLVGAARTLRFYVAIGGEREAGGHIPSVRLRDLSRGLSRGVVPFGRNHIPARGNRHSLVEDVRASPPGKELLVEVARRHARASVKRRALASRARSRSTASTPRISASFKWTR